VCIDCFLYGFAAGGNSAQKSRILTEDAYSILPAEFIVGERTFNALYETGTMRNPLQVNKQGKVKASSSIATGEYIKPGVHFLDIVTLKDVCLNELRYVIGNILRTTRYGALSSRAGCLSNHILGIFCGTTEVPSAYELVRTLHDQMVNNGHFSHPLDRRVVISELKPILAEWQNKRGISLYLSEQALQELIHDIDSCWSDVNRERFLKELDGYYQDFRQISLKNKEPESSDEEDEEEEE